MTPVGVETLGERMGVAGDFTGTLEFYILPLELSQGQCGMGLKITKSKALVLATTAWTK